MIRKVILGMSAFFFVLSLVVFAISLFRTSRCYYFGHSPDSRISRVCIVGHKISVFHGRMVRCGNRMPMPKTTGFAGIVYSTRRTRWGKTAITNRFISVPTWMPPVVLGAFPLLSLWGLPCRRRKSRMARGQCVTCGYDLTGNLSGVCSECGTACRPHAGFVQRANGVEG